MFDLGRLRRTMGRDLWLAPEPLGPGWLMRRKNGDGKVILTEDVHDGVGWLHASIAFSERIPVYEEIVALKAGAFGQDAYAYMVFPPAEFHVGSPWGTVAFRRQGNREHVLC